MLKEKAKSLKTEALDLKKANTEFEAKIAKLEHQFQEGCRVEMLEQALAESDKNGMGRVEKLADELGTKSKNLQALEHQHDLLKDVYMYMF